MKAVFVLPSALVAFSIILDRALDAEASVIGSWSNADLELILNAAKSLLLEPQSADHLKP